jgi:hypothetical protein
MADSNDFQHGLLGQPMTVKSLIWVRTSSQMRRHPGPAEAW